MPDSNQPIVVTFVPKEGVKREDALKIVRWYFGMDDVPAEVEDTFVDDFFEKVSSVTAE